MASPQKENGNTGISNELLEKLLLFDFPSASPLKIWLFIARKTYGFQKKTDHISFTQLIRGVNLSRPSINKGLKWLVNRCLLVKGDFNEKGTVYGVNKDYEQWVVNTPLLVKGSVKSSKEVLTHNINTYNKNYYGVKTPVDKKPMYKEPTIELDEQGEEIKFKPLLATFGRSPALIATHYCQIMGKTAAGRQLPAAKELLKLAQKEYPEETLADWTEQIIARIDVAFKYYEKVKKVKDWNLSKVAENWDKILQEWFMEIKKYNQE